MKCLIIITFLIAASLSSARDYEYNEMRDIVIPMMEQWERYKNMTPEERREENRLRDENMKKYSEFHRELERSDRGENSER